MFPNRLTFIFELIGNIQNSKILTQDAAMIFFKYDLTNFKL